MLHLVTCEAWKLKRSAIVWIILAGAFFSAFITFLQFVMAQSIDSQSVNFEEFYTATIWNDFSMAFPVVITIMGGMVFNQEYSNGTLKSIITIPISITKLYGAKVIAIGILTLALSVASYLFVIAGAHALRLDGIDGFHMVKSFLQTCGMAICIFIAVLPLIIWGFRKVNGYYPLLSVAFMYGFFGIVFISRGIGDFYPITAGLRIIGYAGLPEGGMLAACMAMAAMICISVAMICLIPYSYERAIQVERRRSSSQSRQTPAPAPPHGKC